MWLTGKQKHKNGMAGERFESRPRPTKGCSANINNNYIFKIVLPSSSQGISSTSKIVMQ
jgi:hypothetical protein